MEYRKAGIEDIQDLIRIRKLQLIDEGIEASIDIDEDLNRYFHRTLADDTLVEWLVIHKNQIVATAAIAFYQFPPTYTNKTGIKGYITNMYTQNEYRRQGIATALLEKLVAEARDRGVTKLWLGASKLGRPAYLKFGFRSTNEWLEMDL